LSTGLSLFAPADKQGQLGFPGITQVGNLSFDENGFVIFYGFFRMEGAQGCLDIDGTMPSAKEAVLSK